MINWRDFDFEKTIRTTHFTDRAVARILDVIRSEQFAGMSAEMIFDAVSSKMEIVLFPDFLKRYLYEQAKIDLPYSEVPESFYQEILLESFSDNRAPFSFSEIKTRKSTVVRSWMTRNSVNRNTVLILGFGLKMPAEDVSMVLTKCIQESDFDFTSPKETICWFCFKKGLPFARGRNLIQWYEEAEPEEISPKAWASMKESPEAFLQTETNLRQYLGMLKASGTHENYRQKAYESFLELYNRCRRIISSMHNTDALYIDGGRTILEEEIGAASLEKELCSGIPKTSGGNLRANTHSRFADLFGFKRMSRQRITDILKQKRNVKRFDLITLLFYVYSQSTETENARDRVLLFIDEMNEILKRCGMYELYPVNPYEAFVLMCLASEFPLDVYAEVWEKSYQEEG